MNWLEITVCRNIILRENDDDWWIKGAEIKGKKYCGQWSWYIIVDSLNNAINFLNLTYPHRQAHCAQNVDCMVDLNDHKNIELH